MNRTEALSELLGSKPQARIIDALLKGSLTTKELLDSTKLRQPQVSVAATQLIKLKLVTQSKVDQDGKGRPMHRYTLMKTAYLAYLKELLMERESRCTAMRKELL